MAQSNKEMNTMAELLNEYESKIEELMVRREELSVEIDNCTWESERQDLVERRQGIISSIIDMQFSVKMMRGYCES